MVLTETHTAAAIEPAMNSNNPLVAAKRDGHRRQIDRTVEVPFVAKAKICCAEGQELKCDDIGSNYQVLPQIFGLAPTN